MLAGKRSIIHPWRKPGTGENLQDHKDSSRRTLKKKIKKLERGHLTQSRSEVRTLQSERDFRTKMDPGERSRRNKAGKEEHRETSGFSTKPLDTDSDESEQEITEEQSKMEEVV